jgi:hypothetical protein
MFGDAVTGAGVFTGLLSRASSGASVPERIAMG